MRRATLAFLLAVFIPLTVFASAGPQTVTTQVLSATPARTEVAATFDRLSLVATTNALGAGETAEGYGTILAVAGHGTPSARVLSYDLGDAVYLATALDDQQLDVAPSPDQIGSSGPASARAGSAGSAHPPARDRTHCTKAAGVT